MRGLDSGVFGEASEGVHVLIKVVAQSRLRAVGLRKAEFVGLGGDGQEAAQCGNVDVGEGARLGGKICYSQLVQEASKEAKFLVYFCLHRWIDSVTCILYIYIKLNKFSFNGNFVISCGISRIIGYFYGLQDQQF